MTPTLEYTITASIAVGSDFASQRKAAETVADALAALTKAVEAAGGTIAETIARKTGPRVAKPSTVASGSAHSPLAVPASKYAVG